MTGPTIRGVYAGNPAPAAGSGDRTAVASWNSGDRIIILGATEDSTITLGTPAATGLGSVTAKGSRADANSGWVGAWEGVASSAQTGVTVTSLISGSTSNQGWIMVIVVDPATVSGTIAYTAPTAAATPTMSVVRAGADSEVFLIAVDWGATAARAASPSTNSTAVVAQQVSGKYSTYGLRWTAQGAAGTTSYGVAGANFSDLFTKMAVEIPGTASGGTQTRTPADPVGATDSLAAIVGAARTPADPVGVADALSATRVTLISFADALGAADSLSATNGVTFYHAAADPDGSQFDASPFNDGQPINVSLMFDTTSPATAVGGEYWRAGTGNDGTLVTMSLYAVGAGGTPIAQGTRMQTSADGIGRVRILFTTPFNMVPGQDYKIVAHFPGGEYVGGDLQDSISGQPYQGPLRTAAGASRYVYDAAPVEPTGSPVGYYFAVDVVATANPSSNLSVTLADSAGITDALSAARTAAKTQDDAAGITDSFSVLWTMAPTFADSVGATDAPVTALARSVSFADGLGIADQDADEVSEVGQDVADPLGISDSLTGLWSSAGNVQLADPEGIADAVSTALATSRALADDAGISDALAGALSSPRSQADPVGIADSIDVEWTPDGNFTAVSFADPVGIPDSVNWAQSGPGQELVSDSAVITDGFAVAWARARTFADPVGIPDSVQHSSDTFPPGTHIPTGLRARDASHKQRRRVAP